MTATAKKTATRVAPRKAIESTTLDWGKTPEERYVLRLYVTGMTANSVRAIENMKAICKEYLEGCYDFEIIDIYKHPSLAKGEQIVAAPTLVKSLPLPLRRLVGDLSQKHRVLLGLDLVPQGIVTVHGLAIATAPDVIPAFSGMTEKR